MCGPRKGKEDNWPLWEEEKERRESGASDWFVIRHANGPRGLGCMRTRRTDRV